MQYSIEFSTIPNEPKARINKRLALCVIAFTALGFITACSTSAPLKPKGATNACDILGTHDTWQTALDKNFKKYGVPPHVVMSIIYQESSYRHDARPMKKGFFGNTRASTAYGYAQALDPTWDWYKDKTNNNNAKRDHFPDAVDFIGWYLNENHKRTGISKWDAKNQYLAYHDGTGGFLKKTYKKKPWLVIVSNKVGDRAKVFRRQLAKCYSYPALD